MKIPPLVILGVGAFVTLMSLVSFERGTRIMFMIVGIGFLVYGIVRLFDNQGEATTKHAAQTMASMDEEHITHHAGKNPTFKQVLHKTQHEHPYASCPRCNAKIHMHQAFCHSCGTRLK